VKDPVLGLHGRARQALERIDPHDVAHLLVPVSLLLEDHGQRLAPRDLLEPDGDLAVQFRRGDDVQAALVDQDLDHAQQLHVPEIEADEVFVLDGVRAGSQGTREREEDQRDREPAREPARTRAKRTRAKRTRAKRALSDGRGGGRTDCGPGIAGTRAKRAPFHPSDPAFLPCAALGAGGKNRGSGPAGPSWFLSACAPGRPKPRHPGGPAPRSRHHGVTGARRR
jgi:hypothetical protein